jgi:tRNA threonylcarbamoyladenosine biosynthesis protein TsaE
MDTLLRSKLLKTWTDVDKSEVVSTLIPEINALIESHSIVLLDGELGAGKTSFVSLFLEQITGVQEVSSPTYSLISEYRTYKGTTVYHLDLYRLDNEEELFDLGIEEILAGSYEYLIVEWADLLVPQLKEFYHLAIEKGRNTRNYQLHKVFVPLQG